MKLQPKVLITIETLRTKLNLFKLLPKTLITMETWTLLLTEMVKTAISMRTFLNLFKQDTTDQSDEKRKTTDIFECGQDENSNFCTYILYRAWQIFIQR